MRIRQTPLDGDPAVSRTRVRPSRPELVTGLIVAVAFLVFGVVFLRVLVKDRSGPGVGFLVFWIFCVLVMIGYLIFLLAGRKGVLEIETEAGAPAGETAPSFGAKLRELDRLKRDGLISEDEYRAKRAEIMAEKW